MGDAPGEHQDVLGNETPEAITSAFWTGLEVLTQYGWFILLGIALVLYLWPKFQAYRDRSQEKRENEMLKKYDENSATSRLEAMERSRLRMQESHNSQVEQYQEQEKVKEETKRQQKIEEWEKHKRGAGYHNKYKPAEEQNGAARASTGATAAKKKTPLRRNDYNPLMGDASSSGGSAFRPGRRGGGGGGGGGGG